MMLRRHIRTVRGTLSASLRVVGKFYFTHALSLVSLLPYDLHRFEARLRGVEQIDANHGLAAMARHATRRNFQRDWRLIQSLDACRESREVRR